MRYWFNFSIHQGRKRRSRGWTRIRWRWFNWLIPTLVVCLPPVEASFPVNFPFRSFAFTWILFCRTFAQGGGVGGWQMRSHKIDLSPILTMSCHIFWISIEARKTIVFEGGITHRQGRTRKLSFHHQASARINFYSCLMTSSSSSSSDASESETTNIIVSI